ncbi:hypothetical protein EDB89DRAFT_1576904 [Lactarius sanguifluus]|nr:hypothetical protein EDB89DRAFT_1576904 [Lactarius sanguifluus]
MVPLTGSLYVPGKLRDVENLNVIVDVGTGYNVQKTRLPVPSCLPILYFTIVFFFIIILGCATELQTTRSETHYSYETRVVLCKGPRVVSKPKLGRVPPRLFHLAFHLVSKNNVAFCCCSSYTIPSPLPQPS